MDPVVHASNSDRHGGVWCEDTRANLIAETWSRASCAKCRTAALNMGYAPLAFVDTKCPVHLRPSSFDTGPTCNPNFTSPLGLVWTDKPEMVTCSDCLVFLPPPIHKDESPQEVKIPDLRPEEWAYYLGFNSVRELTDQLEDSCK